MTDPLHKLLAKLRRQPPANERGSSEAKGYAFGGSTGETVYGDRPLRFRNLTLTEADIPALDDPAAATGFKIRISKLHYGRIQAGSLVQQRYAGRGYSAPLATKQDPHLFTFIAYDEGNLMGTVGLRIDSDRGLAGDELYGEEIGALRARGYSLCEFTRLAVDRTSASKPVLAGLFHTAYLFASKLRSRTHAVIEVNPRHVLFYRRALGFEVIGRERVNPRVNAPAVLLGVAFSTIADGLARFAGRVDDPAAGRSLFPYGFVPDEEAGVLKRLRELWEP